MPQKKRKSEAEITRKILQWFKDHHPVSCALEIKATRKNSVPFSAVLPHQLAALAAAASGPGIVHKLTDEARRQQPFDAFLLKEVKAYVVVAFLSPPRAVLAIDAGRWQGATRKSECAFRVEL